MPSVSDWLHTPLTLINTIFENEKDKPGFSVEGFVEQVRAFYTGKLMSDAQVAEVPSLNTTASHSLPAGSLVRYRCMVQDMYDPEYFLGLYQVSDLKQGKKALRSGIFKDVADCKSHESVEYESPLNKTMDRQTLYCVPIPAENQWVKDAFAAQSKVPENTPTVTSQNKRSLDEEDNKANSTTTGESVTMETGDAASNAADVNSGSGVDSKNESSKKLPTEEQNGGSSASGEGKRTKTHNLNFPLQGETGTPCLVKVYGSSCDFKVNDMVEFIGVLSTDPSMAEFPQDNQEKSSFVDPVSMETDSVEHEAHHPPPSLVPRLHVVLATKLNHSNPLIPRAIDAEIIQQNQDLSELLKLSHELRGQLIDTLQKVLYGDSLAAEYLLCHLISSVYSRRDVIALGKFSVNLTSCPANFPTHLGGLISQLVPKSHIIPLTIDNLNYQKFSPKKDYQTNRLTSGQLQLSDNTHLLLDETAMQAGQLNAEGVRNLSALGTVINWQKVEYDFTYHRQDFPCNISVLMCSEGKSLIKCDSQVALAPGQPVSSVEQHFAEVYSRLSEETRNRLRGYLGLVQRLPYSLTEECQKEIENDFVAMRKDDPEKMSVDDFHKLLVLARLVCLSHGQTSMNRQMWEKTKLLESQRKQRLQGTAQTA